VISGVAGAFFVVAANSWMNQPRGFDLVDGKVTNVDPWAAMFNPATWPETTGWVPAAVLLRRAADAGADRGR
jgi:cytochrome d ubiquinol oxidase subunit I